MLILGIDPGTAITGYGLVEQIDELRLVDAGAILTPAGTPLPERLLTIHKQLSSLISSFKPDAVAVEELFFSKNARTAMSVGHARGVVLLTAAQAGLPIFHYKPSEVKVAVTGYGAAAKPQVQEMVRLLLELEETPKPDDVADAIAVAICHLQSAYLHRLLIEE
ncbi:MAG: crossover junction endodeoxyribonuclease RuvC [Anaerolineae bacterium]|nr:crossover junction endodeoxyribonuclease RuvC [Anaerolineae bacterium]MCB9132970.1 crossover junction endodeoxyribonuclease RuvC [Anaerolineales bacterium]MCB0233588.1 crossover junction endodeoxyribonuclease RuvC [Anaerolineae bacterium]MCB0238837.1 crossover junction endodeoxyribonuclease RuvC [Anaerolineae bacterium]MCB0244070.1 crossover junction endodeoxyribonuclease RuvC [Anaerolineae bacterium]